LALAQNHFNPNDPFRWASLSIAPAAIMRVLRTASLGMAATLILCSCAERLLDFPEPGAACDTSTDCGPGQVCAFGSCRDSCPCPESQTCAEDACFTQACDNVTCAAPEVCINGTCGDPRCDGKQCGALLCDPASRNCVQCLTDAHCAAPATCDRMTHTCVTQPNGRLPQQEMSSGGAFGSELKNATHRLTGILGEPTPPPDNATLLSNGTHLLEGGFTATSSP
jgi:hypothetical protein